MAIYRNTKTGVVVDTPCKISGENWERVTKAQLKAESEKNQEPNQNEETEKNQEPNQNEETEQESTGE